MDTVTGDLLARVEDLTARVAEQEAEIKRLKASTGPASLRQTAEARGDGYPTADQEVGAADEAGFLSRRDLFLKGAAGLAATALAASQAEAGIRTTFFADASSTYGLAVGGPASDDPAGYLPPLNGLFQTIVASSTETAPSPVVASNV
jgi:hypothetical protein